MLRRSLWALIVVAVSTTTAQADIVTYQYVAEYSGSFIANNGTINGTTGEDLSLNIYLQESAGSTILSSTKGLGAFGFALTKQSGSTGTTTITAASTTVQPLFAAGFPGFSPPTGAVTSLGVLGSVAINATAGVGPDGNGRILLATVHLNAGSGDTTFNLLKADAIYGPGNTTTFDSPFFNLDLASATAGATAYAGTSANPFSFTVHAGSAEVPEPGSMALCGLAIAGGLFQSWRRRRSSTTKAATVENA